MALRIKELRVRRGWTQQTLAAKAQISRSQLAEIENGTKAVNTRRLGAIASALEVRVEALFVPEDPQSHTDLLLTIAHSLSEQDQIALVQHAETLASRKERTE